MLRMEIACFIILAFVALLYFSARRQHTKMHKTFSAILIVVLIHLIFDGATLYSVNHLDTIPRWINDSLHRVFIGTMVLVVFLFYEHICLIIEEEMEKSIFLKNIARVYLVIAELFICALPISYKITDKGNYEAGIHASVSYVSVAVYIILCIFTVIGYWKQIHYKKKLVIATALAIETSISILQGLNGTWLISGMGITLMTLSFYLTLENPDILLLNQVKEEKKKAEEANASKSRFLSVVSHEIRTPMNAIVGMTELLLRGDLTKEQREYLMNIKNSGDALVMIINDILDQSKIEAGKMELVEAPYELRGMLEDVRMIIENRIGEKPVQLIYTIDDQIPEALVGDGLRLRQVLINLLNNAVKFTEKGYIELGISLEQKKEDELLLYFSIKDSGQGIREEDLNRLFQAFSQVDTKKNHSKEGTGLGLSISRDFVHLMGGQLKVRSEYGAGSEFFFTISQGVSEEAVYQNEEMTSSESMEKEFTAPNARLLVVDDTPMNLMIIKELLEPFKMQIDLAESGMKALELVEQHQYHLILMDYLMPNMDGVETTKRIRSLSEQKDAYYQTVPIIALSGDISEEAKEQFELARMDDFVEKPVTAETLKRVLIKWLPKEVNPSYITTS